MANIRRLNNPRHCFSSDNELRWNPRKARTEHWTRSPNGTHEWLLDEVYPGREYRGRFVAYAIFVPAILGLHTELGWAVNGRHGGAVDPDATCFTAANELGGGLSLNVTAAGGQDNDYTAIHWGGNYPILLRASPHWSSIHALQQITTCGFLIGLVDNTRAAGTAAFALPDNGIFMYYDTDVDNIVRHVIRSNGVSVTNIASPIVPVVGTHRLANIQTNDNGTAIKFIVDGSVRVNWVDISGAAYAALRAAQLQPYYCVIGRDPNILRQLHVHDFQLLMDDGL